MTARRYIVDELPLAEKYPHYGGYDWRVAYRQDDGTLKTVKMHKKQSDAQRQADAAEAFRRQTQAAARRIS